MAPSFPVVEISTVPYAALGAWLRSERCRDLGSALTLLAVSTERGGHRPITLCSSPSRSIPAGCARGFDVERSRVLPIGIEGGGMAAVRQRGRIGVSIDV